ncbi:MAG: hypothetical protein KF787_00705 [Phycisphaeraceae bacterium]|nr:hypothetical protein [Phycisphaerae bacterium]MBX3391142.1 hypothetical protein [Phycisphaeraceae bacterium]
METSRAPVRLHANAPALLIAAALAVVIMDRPSGSPWDPPSLGPSQAVAQVRSVGGGGSGAGAAYQEEPADARVNPADQRKQMIAELRAISQRLDRLEATIAKGLTVKVTDMPEMRLPKSLEARLTERSGN